jgi:hypothetical protein
MLGKCKHPVSDSPKWRDGSTNMTQPQESGHLNQGR